MVSLRQAQQLGLPFWRAQAHKETKPTHKVQAMTDKTKIAAQFIQAIPHAKALGLQLTHIGNGEAEITMPYNEALIGDPKTGVIHGGAVSAMMDTCAGHPGVARNVSERKAVVAASADPRLGGSKNLLF